MTRPDQLFVVRPCRMRDVTQISDLLKASWHAAHDHILGPDHAIVVGRRIYSKLNLGICMALSSLSSRAATLLVATRDGAMVGIAMAQRDDAAQIILYMLYVHPDWQGQGVGSELLDAVVALYADAKVIRLEVLRDNSAAIAWYKAKGFEIYGETKNATGTAGVPALYMDKALDRSAGEQHGW